MSHYFLDTRGLLCPLPVFQVQDKVARLRRGDILETACTDLGAVELHSRLVRPERAQGRGNTWYVSYYFLTSLCGMSHLCLDAPTESTLSGQQIVAGLKIHPELSTVAEIPA